MPFVAAPGVAQFKLQGTVAGNPWNVIVHFLAGGGSGSWTAAQLNAMCTALGNGMTSAFKPFWGNNVSYASCSAEDLSNQTPAIGASASGQGAGTGGPDTVASTCVMFNYPINQKYRGGKPRSYFPGFSANLSADGETWNGSDLTTCETAWATAISNANNAATSNGQPSCNQCVPLYTYTYTDVPGKHKYLKQRSGFKAAGVVLGVTAFNRIRTQRRRLGAA